MGSHRQTALVVLAALGAVGLLVFLLGGASDSTFRDGPDEPTKRAEEEPDRPEPPRPLEEDSGEVAGTGEGAIRVLVVREDETPLAGAQVRAARARAETDAEGRARLEGLPVGRTIPVRATGPEVTDLAAERKVRVEAEPGDTLRLVIREGGAVSGTVTDAGGAPIPDEYRVRLLRLPEGLPAGIELADVGMDISRFGGIGGPPGGDGRFGAGTSSWRIPGVEPGRYVASAEAEGFVRGTSKPLRVEKGTVVRDVEITLSRGGRVSGVVLRALSGEPVKGAEVSLSPDRGAMNLRIGGSFRMPGAHGTTTDDQGRFEMTGVKPGKYVLHADAGELAPAEIPEVVVEPDGETRELLVRLGEGGSITGTVYDERGRPVPGAEVLVQRLQSADVVIMGDFGDRVKANESGVYLAEHLEPGRYRVKLPSGGGGTAMISVRMTAGGPEEPEEPEEPPEDDGSTVLVREGQVSRFDLRTGVVAGIAGRVLNQDREPLRERVQLVEVDVDRSEEEQGPGPVFRIPRFAMPDADGRFEFSGLEPGTWRVVAGGTEEEVTIGPGQVREVELVVVFSSVSGTVTDDAGRPVAGASIRLRRIENRAGVFTTHMTSGGQRTDAKGRFRVSRVATGRYVIEAEEGKRKGRSGEIEVGEGQIVRDVRVRLEALTTLICEIRNADGSPAERTFVIARQEQDFAGSARTNAEGEARLELLPGTYTIMVTTTGDRTAPPLEREVVIGRGGTQTERFLLE